MKIIPKATRLELEDGRVIKRSVLIKISNHCKEEGIKLSIEQTEAVLVELYQLGFCEIET